MNSTTAACAVTSADVSAMKKRKSITMFIENKEGYVSSQDFEDWEDIEIHISTFREGCKITFEENWVEDDKDEEE